MAFFGRSAPPPLSRLDELKKSLQKDPGSRQFLALAEEFRKEGEYIEAIRALENGLRYHPSYVAAHVSLGRVLKESGRPDAALKAFLNALKIDGENLVAIKQAAFLFAEQGDRVEAVKKFKRYRGLNPGDKEVAEQIERLDLELGTTSRLKPSSQGLDLPEPAREPATRSFFSARPGAAPPEGSPRAGRAAALSGVEAPFGGFLVPPPIPPPPPRPVQGPISNPSLLVTAPLPPIETGPNNTPNGTDDRERRNRHLEVSRIVSIPNLLSVSRLLLLPVILLLLQARLNGPALTLMVFSWLSDALDGYLARRLHQVTSLGKILDHTVDKIWVGTVLVMLVATRGLPVYIAAAVIARDLIIVAGSFLILDLRRHVVSSNVVGKITGISFSVLMLLYVVDDGYPWLRTPKLIAVWTVSALIVISLAVYGIFYVRMMRTRTTGA